MLIRLIFPLVLLASAPIAANEPAAPADTTDAPIAASDWTAAEWDLERSEFTPEAEWRFGRLDNGLRYIIRRNNRPEGTALVRMEIAAGSLDERDSEQGYAHFVEHMAFNGSTHVPEGEMVKLLERLGLAFGADTNASTNFEHTQYKLDLPRADAQLLDTALMLMRETASELAFSEKAVEREKGVILSERRVRYNYAYKNVVDGLAFAYPNSLAAARLPIGTEATIKGASASKLRAFWNREYVPSKTVIVVVGDFDPALVAAEIAEHFGDWEAAPSPEQPGAGPVDSAYAGEVDIYLDPALTETVSILRHGDYLDRPDTRETRFDNLLRTIGAQIIGRRLQRLLRSEDPPFRGVRVGTDDFFEAARTTQLSVSTEEGAWQRGLDVALDEYRRALAYGFSEAEIAEQVSKLRNTLENAAANASTRSNAKLVGRAFKIVHGDYVPIGPAADLALFESLADQFTPANVLAALRENVVALDNPLIRFSGKSAPQGGEAALRSAVKNAFARKVTPPEKTEYGEFAYTDFGTPGQVVSDSSTGPLGIRRVRFANGVMLNLKHTDLAADRVSVELTIDGGKMLESREAPLAVELTSLIPGGGLGKHSRDALQSILAGHSVGASLHASAETFTSSKTTTPEDLELQLQLMAAYLTDPGYRPEGMGPWRNSLADFFARLGHTPRSALGEALGPILSDGDPRFTRQPIEAYRALDYDALAATIGDRLKHGAIEIAIVGDFNEADAIRFVAQTFGALPSREEAFRPYDDERRIRSFTADRGLHTVIHQGEPDQALIRFVWPTDDDDDWQQTSALNLLARIAQIELTDRLREDLGQTYSPIADSDASSVYRGYGTFTIGAQVDVSQIEAAHRVMMATIKGLIAQPPSEDVIRRARKPLLESLANALKTNSGWLQLVDRAQSRPEDIERFRSAEDRYQAITGPELQALAARYLDPAKAVEIQVIPAKAA